MRVWIGTIFTALAVTVGVAGTAAAEVDIDAAGACVREAAVSGGNPADCVEAAQVGCLDNAAETPAVAVLCFAKARGVWSMALAPRLNEFAARVPEPVAAAARIETKYDMLGALIECDRLEELSVVSEGSSGEEIGLQKARCQAAASGLAFVRLVLRTEEF